MKRSESKSVLIIIPAYNEETVIADTLKKIISETKKLKKLNTKIVLVNDGSSDNTKNIAEKYVEVLNHFVNMGSGAATRTGLAYARRNDFDFAVTIDADGQHSPEDMTKIINKLVSGGSDLLVGSRLINSRGMPTIRLIGNNFLNFITRILLGVKVSDSQSGLKGFSKKAIEIIDIKTNGYEFCSEIIWKAKKANLKITETPIKAIYTDYSLSKGQSNINALRIIKSIIIQKVKEV